jgi:hypothetical protein
MMNQLAMTAGNSAHNFGTTSIEAMKRRVKKPVALSCLAAAADRECPLTAFFGSLANHLKNSEARMMSRIQIILLVLLVGAPY